MNRVFMKKLRYCIRQVESGTKYWTRTQSSSSEHKLFENDDKKPTKVHQKKESGQIKTITQQKLPSRKPLLKNFLIGIVDNELLPFPEVISRDDKSKLNDELSGVAQYFYNESDVKRIDLTHCIDLEIKDKLNELGIFGYNIPQHLGGSGYFMTENLVAAEPTGVSTEIAQILSTHSLVADMLLQFGTDYQKKEILPQLATGAMIATDAFCELSNLRNNYFNTVAEYDDVEKKWILNGEKAFVVNGKNASLFLVLVETKKLNIAGDITPGVTAFLVDAKNSAIKYESQITLGCKASEFTTLTFKNVHVPETAVVGEVNGGNDMAQYLLTYQRLRMSLVNLGLMKSLIKLLTEYCITKKHGHTLFKDLEIVGRRISELVCKTYALESMIYFTSGLIDEFDAQDIVLEAAAAKLYALEALWSAVSSPKEFMGSSSLLSGSATEIILRNAAQISTHGETKDSLCLFIGLLGLQHAGVHSYETIKKERNPLFYPGYMINKIIKQESLENPKAKWQLHEDLHPTLVIPSQLMEQSIARLQLSAQALLTRYGTEVLDKHTDIKRISEMISLIFSMFTSLSRSSRSYCIGLKSSDYEILLAATICYHATERIKELASQIHIGPYGNCDKNHMKIAKQVFKNRGYFFEHPTAYNF